jgi:cytochrome c
MKAHAEGGKIWDYAELDAYLASPKTHIPSNKMSFSGLKKEKDRAAILAYLRTLATDPAPLP